MHITSTSHPTSHLHHLPTLASSSCTITSDAKWQGNLTISKRALLVTCGQGTSYHSHWLQTWTAKCTKQGPTKIPQSVAKCSNTTSSKAPPPPHEHYLEVLPSMALLVSMTSLRDKFFSQSDWGGYTSMRLLTTNGMDVKVMKGYTNPSKQDVSRYPSEFGRVSPTGSA